MSTSLGRPRIATVAVGLVATIAWVLSRPDGVDGAHAWLAQALPPLARLLDRYLVLLSLAFCWALWREPRSGPAVLVLAHVAAALNLFELPMNLFLGALLAFLTAVGLVARPWPNRVVIGRCIVLTGFAVALDAVAH